MNPADQDLTSRYLWIGYGFNIVFNCLASLLLISRADFITSMLSKGQTDNIQLGLSKRDSIELIIIAISLLVLLQAIPAAATRLTSYVYLNPNEQGRKTEFWSQRNNAEALIFAAFKLIAGLMAITNARTIANKLTKIGEKDD